MTVQLNPQGIEVILLDIEGTIAPIDFVVGTLFPFAKRHLRSFLAVHNQDLEVIQALDLLFDEHDQDLRAGLVVPPWDRTHPKMAIEYIIFLIDSDRKSTGLKSLQGMIWHQGYQSGELKSRLFSDTKPAFERWLAAGKSLYIFSSGSVQAQKLLFQYSEVGDLTPYLSGYFDTRIGPKKLAKSYEAIANNIGVDREKILFISDIEAELEAARTSGMQTLLSIRPGNQGVTGDQFLAIRTLDQVL